MSPPLGLSPLVLVLELSHMLCGSHTSMGRVVVPADIPAESQHELLTSHENEDVHHL